MDKKKLLWAALAATAGCGAAARAILSVFGGQGGLAGAIEDSVAAGQNFIDGALAAGRNFLNSLMGL